MTRRLSSSASAGFGRWTVVLLLLAVLVVGIWIGRETTTEPAEQPPGRHNSSAPQESRRVNGVPLGFAQTELGAVEAATNFTRAMATVAGDSDAYIAAAETMAAPEWTSEARRLARNGLRFLRERYGATGSLTFTPLRYRVVSFSDTEAEISIWGVTVASGPKIQGIEESWLTGTLNLSWISDDWRLTGQKSEVGPTPELLQATEHLPNNALNGFQEYENAPSP